MLKGLAVLALCALTVLVYSNTFRGDFVLDGKAVVLDDPRVQAATVDNVKAILLGPHPASSIDGSRYRPAATLSYLFNYTILRSQRSPVGYHVVNTLLHVCNVLLLFALAWRVAGRAPADTTGAETIWWSAGVAALWAVHPVSTEAVTNIAGRPDLLAATGILLALYAHVRASDAPESHRPTWFLVKIAAGTLAVLSNESGMVVVPVLVLFDVFADRAGSKPGRVSGNSVATALLLVPVALVFYQRSTIPSATVPLESLVENPIAGASVLTGRLTALAVMGRYLWLTLWPSTLSTDYSYAQIPLSTGTLQEWAAWLTLIAAVAGTALLLARGRRLAFFAASFAFVTLLPTANLLFPASAVMAEHFLYTPLAGLVAWIVLAVASLRSKIPDTRAAVTTLALGLTIAIAVLAARAWDRNKDWQDEVTLWTSAVRAAPNSFKAHLGLAEALNQEEVARRDLPRIAAEADRAIAILDSVADSSRLVGVYRRAVGFHLQLGDRLSRERNADPAEAERMYRRAAVLTERYVAMLKDTSRGGVPSATDPTQPGSETADAYQRLAGIYLRLRDTERTLDAARLARELQPFDAMGYRLASVALTEAKRLDEAAVLLLTGFLVTGDGELRQASIDLYASDPGPKNCALKKGREGIVLDANCPLVRDHLCTASARAAAIQREHGQADRAEQLHATALQAYGCQIR